MNFISTHIYNDDTLMSTGYAFIFNMLLSIIQGWELLKRSWRPLLNCCNRNVACNYSLWKDQVSFTWNRLVRGLSSIWLLKLIEFIYLSFMFLYFLFCYVWEKKIVAVIYCICVMHSSLECYKLSLLGAKRPYLHEVVHHVIIILISVIDCVLSLSVKAF